MKKIYIKIVYFSFPESFYICTQNFEIIFDFFIASVNVTDTVNYCCAFCGKTRNNKCSAASQVCAAHS